MSLSVAACARASRRARTAQPAPPVFRLDTARQPRDPTSVGKGRDRGRTRAMSVRQGPWTVADVPGQGGRTAVVTGANSGIGFEAAAVLARCGADTVLACRDAGKAEAAAARITAAAPGAAVSVVRLDLASLDSVRAAAAEILAGHQRLDLRSEEHTSELQSRPHLVCRLLLEKKKQQQSLHPCQKKKKKKKKR